MHAFLLTGSNEHTRRHQALNQVAKFLSTPLDHLATHPDICLLENTSLGIDTVRFLRHFAHQQPFQAKGKAALILEAHALTLPAQHALLKTLEEPPGNTIIILTTPNPHLLLSTIVSRCQVTVLPHTLGSRTSGVAQLARPWRDSPEVKIKAITQLLNQLPHLSPSQRLTRVGEYATSRDTAINFCESLLAACRHHLRHHHNFSPATLRHIFMALTRLNLNVNPRLTLEQLLLNL